jgi:hypothetical protein
MQVRRPLVLYSYSMLQRVQAQQRTDIASASWFFSNTETEVVGEEPAALHGMMHGIRSPSSLALSIYTSY